MRFDSVVDVDAWVKATGNTDQQQVEKLVAAIREEGVVRELGGHVASLPAISAELDEICERLGWLTNAHRDPREELLKLDMIAQSIRLLAGACTVDAPRREMAQANRSPCDGGVSQLGSTVKAM